MSAEDVSDRTEGVGQEIVAVMVRRGDIGDKVDELLTVLDEIDAALLDPAAGRVQSGVDPVLDWVGEVIPPPFDPRSTT